MPPPHHITTGKDKNMTYYTVSRLFSGVFRKFSPLAALLRAERAYRDRQHLLSLSDEHLNDIGLKRSDLQ